MTDNYPEHLNPFADEKPRPKLTIRDSFKELKKNLRQSFRIKKKENDEVTIRQKSETLRRLPLSYPNQQNEALPRSRFRERVTTTITSFPGPNPFEEEEKRQNATTARRRGKKRAPLPPKSMSSQNVSNLEASSGGSHWSLTSADTDCSLSTDNGSRDDEVKKDAMIDEFKDFNKNMEALKDDNLVISCPKDTEKSEELEESVQEIDNLSVISEGDTSDLIVKDITSNVIEEEKDVKNEEEAEEPDINYCEKKSLYIAGSRDDLDDSSNTFTGRVSLYITGSCDDLDASNNNEVCNKSVTDENNISDAVPTPKQRKNKLSKNILLGKESVCN
ncbi:uncharacterized protein LOC123006621 isoform X2 [Tribolium madens]|uniref:uncharacterized protein LOC123006621 isoform X2 n=1 Tax=Tribolium madens TaxID=41895 RepID=UPI001CF71E94|nr:uncharacterized protein LOC123006621 isoform X2 [Tribolium madens]